MRAVNLRVRDHLVKSGFIIGKRHLQKIVSRDVLERRMVLDNPFSRLHRDIVELTYLANTSVHISTILVKENSYASPWMGQVLGIVTPRVKERKGLAIGELAIGESHTHKVADLWRLLEVWACKVPLLDP